MSNTFASPHAVFSGAGTEIGGYEPTVFSVSGRIGRLRYLAYSFCTTLVLSLILGAVGGKAMTTLFTGGEVGVATMVAIGVLYLAIIVTSVIIARRRANDLNRSGWWLLLLLVPLVNVIFGFYLVFGRGTDGENRFGPPPAQNTKLVVVGALFAPIIFTVGVLAAVAIPAYQHYMHRADEAQAMPSEILPTDASQESTLPAVEPQPQALRQQQ